LSAGAKPDIVEARGFTPLFSAAQADYAEVVRALLKAGASSNTVSTDGNTPLSWAAGLAGPDVLKSLIEAGARVNGGQLPALVVAAADGNATAAAVLIDNGANVNVSDKNGMTPLMWAAQRSQEDSARLLLQHGADPLKKSVVGKLARDYATDPNILRLLIIAGNR
jgi:hypothetical protein